MRSIQTSGVYVIKHTSTLTIVLKNIPHFKTYGKVKTFENVSSSILQF